MKLDGPPIYRMSLEKICVFNLADKYDLSFRLTKVQHHYSLTNAFQLVFSGKAYCKVDF